MIQKLKDLLINLNLKIERYKKSKYYFRVSSKNKINKHLLPKEQKFSIDKLYKETYGHKISYATHNLITNYNSKFDVNYIPTDIFLKFIDILNKNYYRYNVFKDKNFLYTIAKLANVKVPKRYFYSINGLFFDSK